MHRATSYQINYHPQSGWFEDTPLKGGTEEGCPLKGVHEGTCLIEARQPAWNHSRASGLTVVLRLGLLCGVGSGTPPQDVLSSHSTPERQSLFESHRQRRWLTRWSYWTCVAASLRDMGRVSEKCPENLGGLFKGCLPRMRGGKFTTFWWEIMVV